MIRNSLYFKESLLAHELLDGLKGVEIGGSAHNAFGLDCINVDKFAADDPRFKKYRDEQEKICGEFMPVDVVSDGDKLPFKDGEFDFVISSHVIEHFFDPIGAIREWMRVASKYIFIICPQPDALESDRGKEITPLEELINRFQSGGNGPDIKDEHHTRWTCQGFANMCMWMFLQDWGKNWETCAVENPDGKVGNGFTIVLKRNT